MRQLIKISLLLLSYLMSSLAPAGTITIPNTFSSGRPAVASEVNANFNAVKTAVDDNDSRTTTNTSNISNNSGRITTLENDNSSSLNRESIAALEQSVDTHNSSSSINSASITTLGQSVNANINNISTNSNAIRFVQAANPSTKEFSTADNAVINVDCGAGESLQAAIEGAPTIGKVKIVVSGACNDDILVRRSNITISGAHGPTTDSISGDASGFSSASPSFNYDSSVTNTLLVNRSANNVRSAVEINARTGVIFENLIINGSSNRFGMRIYNGSQVSLSNVIINAGSTGLSYGLRVIASNVSLNNSTINGGGAGTGNSNFFAGSGLYADRGANITLNGNNTFNSTSDTSNSNIDAFGFILMGNSNLRIGSSIGNNIINSGLGVFNGSSFIQSRVNDGNQINGDLEVCSNSSFLVQKMTINTTSGNENEIEVCEGSQFGLSINTVNDVAITAKSIKISSNSGFVVFSDADPQVGISINAPSGQQATMTISCGSTLKAGGGSRINMNVDIFNLSTGNLVEDSKINGNLKISGVSIYFAKGNSVSGTINCIPGSGSLGSDRLGDFCSGGTFHPRKVISNGSRRESNTKFCN